MAVDYRDSYGEETETAESQQQRMIHLLSEQNKLLSSISYSLKVLLGSVFLMIIIFMLLNWN